MPIFYVPDNTPSRNYGRNSRTEGYAHPAHGIIGGLAKSDTDPRNRGRKRSRQEIEDSSNARNDAKRERLAKLREEVETKKAADKEAKEAKRLRVTADKSAAALANNPEAARREVARQQTAAEAAARRSQPLKRLTPEEIAANEKAINAREAAARETERQAGIAESRARVGTMDKLMSERMKPEGPSLSDTLAASEAAGRPHVARAVSNLFANQQAAPNAAQAPTNAEQERDTRALGKVSIDTQQSPHDARIAARSLEQAAMNPSGADRPWPHRQGFHVGNYEQSKALSNLPESDRKFVENQYRDLQEQGFVPNFLEAAAGLFVGNDDESNAARYDALQSIDRGVDAIVNPITAGFNNAAAGARAAKDAVDYAVGTGATNAAAGARAAKDLVDYAVGTGATNAASGARAIKDTVDSAISSGVESTVNAATDAMNAFKPSMSFRPGMEFGEPKSQPTAIGANATGIGAAPPERKKETFMDWLRSNLPDSFSDPNSMYYFPGKFY